MRLVRMKICLGELSIKLVQILPATQFHVGERPDGLFEDVEIGEEVADRQEHQKADDSRNGVAQGRGEKRGQQEADANRDSGNQEDHDGIQEYADTDDEEQYQQEHDVAQVTDDQLEAAANGDEDAGFADDHSFLREAREELEQHGDQPDEDQKDECCGGHPGIVSVADNHGADDDGGREVREYEHAVYLQEREEVVECEHQATFYLFFPMCFRGETYDGTGRESGHEELQNQENHDDGCHCNECPEWEIFEEELLDREPPLRQPFRKPIHVVGLVKQKLDIAQRFEQGADESPVTQRALLLGDRPGFCDDFSGCHGMQQILYLVEILNPKS